MLYVAGPALVTVWKSQDEPRRCEEACPLSCSASVRVDVVCVRADRGEVTRSRAVHVSGAR